MENTELRHGSEGLPHTVMYSWHNHSTRTHCSPLSRLWLEHHYLDPIESCICRSNQNVICLISKSVLPVLLLVTHASLFLYRISSLVLYLGEKW